jgi:hypothetical protein
MVTVRAYEQSELIALGTGFFIREDGVLVTNLHVVEDATSVTIEVESGEIYDNVYVLSADERRDLIILQIPLSSAPTLKIGDDREAEVGDSVFVIGNPLGFKGTFSDGLISAKRVEEGVSYLQITAPISEGSSGGPVINENGQVIGISTLTMAEGQNLNLAVPARYAADMLIVPSNPVAFEDVAASSGLGSSGNASLRANETETLLELLPEEVRAELQELDPYEQQTILRLWTMEAILEESGWEGTDHYEVGQLATGKVDRLSVTLERDNYIVVGVCDDDCIDLDIYVLDSDGDIIAQDILDDAEPMPEFEVTRRGTYHFGTSMESCSTDTCIYALKLYRQQ